MEYSTLAWVSLVSNQLQVRRCPTRRSLILTATMYPFSSFRRGHHEIEKITSKLQAPWVIYKNLRWVQVISATVMTTKDWVDSSDARRQFADTRSVRTVRAMVSSSHCWRHAPRCSDLNFPTFFFCLEIQTLPEQPDVVSSSLIDLRNSRWVWN